MPRHLGGFCNLGGKKLGVLFFLLYLCRHTILYTIMHNYNRTLTLIAVMVTSLSLSAQSTPSMQRSKAQRHPAGIAMPKAAAQRTPCDVTLLSEDFNKFTAGTEAHPDQHDLCEEKRDWCIDPALLQTPGWNGGGIYQAGGCANIYTYYNDFDGQHYLGYLESPRFDTTASRGEFIVCFRARSVLEQDWLGVCGVPTNHSEAKQKFAVIGQEWGYYEVTLHCGDENTCVQFEPLSESCFIDDVRIIQVLDDGEGDVADEKRLDTPEALPVDDYSPEGYTARWNPVNGAEDYAVYDQLYFTSTQEGATFDYIDTDFSRITAGSEDAPENPGGDNDFYSYLDDFVDRADWLAYLPMYAGGCLAFDNSYAEIMPAGISSPSLSLGAPGSDLYISMAVKSPSLSTMTLYAYGKSGPLGDVTIPLTPEWRTHTVTIPACEDGVSFELVIEDMEPGVAFLDDLHVWQHLPKGTTAHVAASYHETAATSMYIATAPSNGCRHAFTVSAYQYSRDEEGDVTDYVMSRWSAPIFADGLPAEGIVRIHNALPVTLQHSIDGRLATGSERFVISGGRTMLK